MPKLIRLVRLNGLQYNPNRDPQAYRRVAGEAFRIEVLVGPGAAARCTLHDAAGALLRAADVTGDDTFVHEVAFDAPGSRVVTLEVARSGEVDRRDLRLDVLAHAWVG